MKRKHLFLVGLSALVFSFCSNPNGSKYIAQQKLQKESFKALDIKVEGDTNTFKSTLTERIVEDGIKVYTLTLSSEKPQIPQEMKLHWRIPSADICGQWNTGSQVLKYLYPEWSGDANVNSRTAVNSPVITLYSNTDQNRITFACSDALNLVTLHTGVKEEDGFIDCKVILFKEKVPAFKDYSVDILFDTRSVHFSEAISNVSDWWAKMPQLKPTHVPEHARLPMYSTWYSFHQNLVVSEVLKQCRLAKKLGYESVIVDDGWQTTDGSRGYAFTGDWKPERIPQFKAFVDNVHAIGMKFILWYSVPYIGEKSDNYKQFAGKYLNYWGGKWGGCYTLDPRYPEVREFLIQTYVNAVKEWGLDGFKLDFIDSFVADEKTKLTAENGRDYASVNEAVDRLMTDITASLKSLNPDILIEFRQSYIGPLMRKYGNMFRAGDCPNSYNYNRLRTTDLRLLSGNTAVHSDMVMWNAEEPVESAALQLIHTIFSVPQLSVLIDKLPKEHFDMVRFWNKYWLTNRDVLLNGKFVASRPANSYTQLSACNSEKQVIAVYANELVTPLNQELNLDIINGKLLSGIVTDMPEAYNGKKYIIFDCKGNKTEEGTLRRGLQIVNVPAAGFVQIQK